MSFACLCTGGLLLWAVLGFKVIRKMSRWTIAWKTSESLPGQSVCGDLFWYIAGHRAMARVLSETYLPLNLGGGRRSHLSTSGTHASRLWMYRLSQVTCAPQSVKLHCSLKHAEQVISCYGELPSYLSCITSHWLTLSHAFLKHC